jgi:peptidyl-prolyl cis-trans isomerase C
MTRATLIAAALALPLLAAAPAYSQGSPSVAAGSVTVATVDGTAITADEVQSYYDNLPPQFHQVPIEQLYPQLVDRLVDQRLLANAARKAGLDKTPAVRQRLEMLTNGVLQDAYLREQVEPQVTEEKLRDEYRRQTAQQPKREEVRASHILLKTRDEAVAVIDDIRRGADFAAVAREKSIDPAGRNGGDLGYFTREQMVKPFSDAAFTLKAGEITTQPVETQFGWHVIRVEDRRMAGVRPFDEMADELRQKITEDVYDEAVQQLRSAATITTPGIDRIQPIR